MFDDFVDSLEEQEYKARLEVKSVLDTIRKANSLMSKFHLQTSIMIL